MDREEKLKDLYEYCEKQCECKKCKISKLCSDSVPNESLWEEMPDENISAMHEKILSKQRGQSFIEAVKTAQRINSLTLDETLANYEQSTKASEIDHPSHYQGNVECIDEMEHVFGIEAVKDFCKLNVWKYRYRAESKNGKEDLEKADWYMNKLIELNQR